MTTDPDPPPLHTDPGASAAEKEEEQRWLARLPSEEELARLDAHFPVRSAASRVPRVGGWVGGFARFTAAALLCYAVGWIKLPVERSCHMSHAHTYTRTFT